MRAMDAPHPDARTRVLDAAEAIVAARGVPALTLDAAAREAGVSKGGLLYHFPSKEALLRGLMQRMASEMEADFEATLAETPPGRGHTTRAVIAWAFHNPPEREARHLRIAGVLLAAYHHDPALVDPVRALHARIRGLQAEDGLPPGRAAVVRSTADGLFMAQVFRIYMPSAEEAAAIEAELTRLANDP